MRYFILTLLASIVTTTMLFAQKVEVSGTVVDEQEQPLVGATVIVTGKSGKQGTVTDADGFYKIRVSKVDTLIFNYLGHESLSFQVGNRTRIDVTLKSLATSMDEVVVVGYGTQRRSDISTAVTSVNVEEMKKSGSSQILQGLQGKISGVDILTSDGSLTSGLNIKVRGVNSITGGTQPLFVIDGVPIPPQNITTNGTDPINNPLLGLNPNDIASMEVLKDAAAAAIYGANGANGVIIINTKQGTIGDKPRVVASYTFGIDQMAPTNLEMASPEEYAYKMLKHSTFNNPTLVNYWQKVIDTKGWNDPLVKNWLEEVTQLATKHDANVSVSGGSRSSTYMLSLGYLSNTGLIKRSEFDRFTSRINLRQKLNAKLNLEFNASFSSSKDTNPVTDWSQSGIVLNALRRSPYLLYPGFSELQNNMDITETQNPLTAINEVDILNNYNEFIGKAALNYNILPGLSFVTSYSYRMFGRKESRFWGPNTWYGQSEQGRMELADTDDANWVYEARIQYNKTFGNRHNFSIMGAYEMSKWSTKKTYSKATGFEDTALGIWGIDQGLVTYTPTYTYDANNSISYISRATYSYANKYIVNASIRVDGSSKFGKNNKYGYFPAVSVAWCLSQESFLSRVRAISNLRLRASFGMTGNKQIPSYQSLSLLGINKVPFDDGTVEVGRYPTTVANDDLRWESQKQYNIGVDLGILRNRFTLTADVYTKRIDDMLLEVNIPSTSGYQKAWKNSGSMRNRGFDLSLSAKWFTPNKRNGGFGWSTDFNLSMYRNKVLSLADGQYQQFYDRGLSEKIQGDVLLRVGEPVGLYYGYVSDGVYNTEAEVANGPTGPNLSLGSLKVVDLDNNGVIDSNDRTIIADVNPLHTGGIGNSFSFKGFDLYVFFRWSYGNDVINANAFYLDGSANYDNVLKDVYKNVWSADKPDNNYPLYGTGQWGSTVFRSDLVEDGSFLRLQTVALGYNLPEKILKKLHVKNLRISLTASNLWLWTRYSGFDPEANTGYGVVSRLAPGFDRSPYPRPRSFALSAEIQF